LALHQPMGSIFYFVTRQSQLSVAEAAMKPRRSPEAAVARRRAVLAAALHEFAENGYDGTGMRAIAARAGLEPGHLAYYARSKELLWQAVVQDFASGLLERLALLTPADAARMRPDQARALLASVLGHFAANPKLTRLMLHEFSVASARNDWVVRHMGQPVWRRLRPLFRSLQARGLVRGRDPALAYFSLVGSMILFCGSQPEIMRIAGRRASRRPGAEAMISYLLDGLFRTP
jgi:TetR/AcrR family transcriptional regulator